MGTLERILVIYIFFCFNLFFSQNCIIKVEKEDSVKLKKIDSAFYDEYLIVIKSGNKKINYKVTPDKIEICKSYKTYTVDSFLKANNQKKCNSQYIFFSINNSIFRRIRTF